MTNQSPIRNRDYQGLARLPYYWVSYGRLQVRKATVWTIGPGESHEAPERDQGTMGLRITTWNGRVALCSYKIRMAD